MPTAAYEERLLKLATWILSHEGPVTRGDVFAKFPDLTDDQRAAIGHAMQRLQNQLLHHPRAALRSAAADAPGEHTHPLLHAVRHLFGHRAHPFVQEGL